MKTYLECLSEAAALIGKPNISADIKLQFEDEHYEVMQAAADMYAELSNSHKHSVSALEQMPDDKLDKLIKQVEAACAESAKDTVAEHGACGHECTGPWDCQCQDILKEYYSGAGKSSEEQL